MVDPSINVIKHCQRRILFISENEKLWKHGDLESIRAVKPREYVLTSELAFDSPRKERIAAVIQERDCR